MAMMGGDPNKPYGIFDRLLSNRYGQSTIPDKLSMDGDPHGPIVDKPSEAQGLPMHQNLAAAGAGIGQALMGGKMGRAFNAATSGYQQLYKLKAYPDAYHNAITGPAPDDMSNEVADRLNSRPSLQSKPFTRFKPGGFKPVGGGF